jgi:hypothetical protein
MQRMLLQKTLLNFSEILQNPSESRWHVFQRFSQESTKSYGEAARTCVHNLHYSAALHSGQNGISHNRMLGKALEIQHFISKLGMQSIAQGKSQIQPLVPLNPLVHTPLPCICSLLRDAPRQVRVVLCRCSMVALKHESLHADDLQCWLWSSPKGCCHCRNTISEIGQYGSRWTGRGGVWTYCAARPGEIGRASFIGSGY